MAQADGAGAGARAGAEAGQEATRQTIANQNIALALN